MTYRSPEPDDLEVLMAWLEQHSLSTHTAFPGQLQNYDPVKQVADIIPLIRHPVPQPDGSYVQEELPVLPHVRVIFPRSAGFFLAFNLHDGDTVLVICCEGDIAGFTTGRGPRVRDLTRHSLSHAVAIPGFVPHANALRRLPALDSQIGMMMGSDAEDGPRIVIRADGVVEITKGSSVSVKIDADGIVHLGGASADQFVALANLVTNQLSALKTAISGAATAPSDGGAVFKANILAALSSWPESVAATKTKAT